MRLILFALFVEMMAWLILFGAYLSPNKVNPIIYICVIAAFLFAMCLTVVAIWQGRRGTS